MSKVTASMRAPELVHGDGGEDVPVTRQGRGRSASLTEATIDHIDARIRDQVGAGLRPELKAIMSAEIEGQVDRLLEELRGSASATTSAPVPGDLHPPRNRFSGRVGWAVAALLGALLFAGTLGVTWFEIYATRQSNRDALAQQSGEIANVRRAQQADDEYAMIVANWLVTEAAQSYRRAENVDTMIRRIAEKIDADVEDIAKPQQIHPPTAVQRRNNDYKLSKGE